MLRFATEHHSITSHHKKLLLNRIHYPRAAGHSEKKRSFRVVGFPFGLQETRCLDGSNFPLDLKGMLSLYWERQEEGAEVEVR